MLDKIIDYYKKRNVNLPRKEAMIISEQATRRTLNKKEFFYKAGEKKPSMAYITNGCVRIFIEDHKKIEYNRYFAFEGSCVGEFHQILNDQPAKISIQAVEKTELIEVSSEGYKIILNQCPVFILETLKMHLDSYARIIEKEELKKTLTIEELYTDLIENNSEIIERVPLYHIASYLGVKPESLSRVKKKFKTNSTQETIES